jgi:hypothetical protein
VNLDTYNDPDALYTARGDEVNPNRPLFTGDVFRDMPIPGVQEAGMGMILAHPCSFRRGAGQLSDRVLVASVRAMQSQGTNAWRRGLFDRMPLPDLDGQGLWATYFGDIGQATVTDLVAAERLACLSGIGINMLQQRLTCYLTRAAIPTRDFDRAFSHNLEEADLLEDWIDTLIATGWEKTVAAEAFERFIRNGEPTLQEQLLDPQRRSHVRLACKSEAARLAGENRLGRDR